MKTEILFLQGLNREITFYVGQNKHENFDVIDKGQPDDLWFHSNDMSSCHVIANVPDDLSNKQKKYVIKAGALLCKKYTNKLKNLNNVEIIYTKIKNVTKTKTPGCVTTQNTKTIII